MRTTISSLAAFSLLLLVGCSAVNQTSPYGTGHDDSNTVNSLSNINPALTTYGGSSYPSQLYNSLSKEDANRWSEQGAPFQNWVSTVAHSNSCLGTTGGTLTMTPAACVAYNAGYRSTETGPITFPNASICWVAMDENTTGNNAGLTPFVRVASTHYLIDCTDVTQPPMVPDSQILMKVTTAGGAITAVVDLRTTTSIIAGGTVALAGDANGASGANQVTATHLSAALPSAQGGSGFISPTAHDVMVAEGASPFALLNLGADTFLQGQGSSLDPTAGTLPNCANDGAHASVYSTSTHSWSCATILSSIGTHGRQMFLNSGTFTVPANVFSVTFEAWGPGGGGGGFGSAATNGANGNAATTVVISATTYVKGTAGFGGAGAAAASAGIGGVAGFGSNGTFNIGGQAGFSGFTSNGTTVPGGAAARGDGGGGVGTCVGAGGGGAGSNSTATGGGGGGAGGYSQAQVTTTPSTAFTVTIGTGGAAGTGGTGNGTAGCNGGVLASW